MGCVVKKILIVTTISGFLPQFEKNDVKILQEYGYEIHYASNFNNPIYYCNQEQLREQGIVLHQIDIDKSPLSIVRNVKAFFSIRHIIKSEKINAVHCHNPVGGVVGRLATVGLRKRPYVIYTAHGFHFYKGAPWKNWVLYYTAEKLMARFTDQIVTINKEDLELARKFKLRKNGKVDKICGVGVDNTRFVRNEAQNALIRGQLNIPIDAFHIVTAAELNDNKNQAVIIEAIAELGRSNVYYSICGSGPNEEVFKKLIKEKNLEKQVKLLGYRNDMPDILSAADCFAFPSKREGLGIAAVEALLCGVPVIGADNRGTREYLRDDSNGIVCKSNKKEGYVKAIRALMDNPNLRRRYSQTCRDSAIRFTTNEVDRVMRAVYQNIK